MPIDKTSIGAGVAEQLPLFFQDTVDQFVQGEGQYLSTGEPQSVVSKIGQQVGRAACRIFGSNPDTLAREPATRFEKACRPYLDRIGQGSGGVFGPVVRGGQCNAIYTVSLPSGSVRIRRTVCTTGVVEFEGNAPSRGLAGVQGPIQRIFPKAIANGNCGVIDYNAVLIDGNGVERAIGSLASTTATRKLEIIAFAPEVFRSDGLPDDCGDGPDPEGNPVPGPDPLPPPFRYTDGRGIDIDIDASVDVDGNITFNIGGGPITINPFGGGSGGGSGGAPPGDVGEPGAAADAVGGGEDAEGEAPPGKVLTGLKVDIISDDGVLDKYTPEVRRGVGYFYMGVPGLLDQDFGGSMLRSGQFLFAEKDNLTAWRASARVGVTLRITPYYREADNGEPA